VCNAHPFCPLPGCLDGSNRWTGTCGSHGQRCTDEADGTCRGISADRRIGRRGANQRVGRNPDWSATAGASRLRGSASSARAGVRVGRRILVPRRAALLVARRLLDSTAVPGRAMDHSAIRRPDVLRRLLGWSSRPCGARPSMGRSQRSRSRPPWARQRPRTSIDSSPGRSKRQMVMPPAACPVGLSVNPSCCRLTVSPTRRRDRRIRSRAIW
jgi:hypothetical protein